MRTQNLAIKIFTLIAVISGINLFLHIMIDYAKGRSAELGPFFTFDLVVMVLSALTLAVLGIRRLIKGAKNGNRTES